MEVLVIGIDGLDYNLWKEAKTPFLDSLKDEAAWGMMVPEVAISPQSWATIATGLSSRHHKVTNFYTSITKKKVPNLWRVLNDYGLTTGVFNFTMTKPPEVVKGFMVSGMPGPYKSWPEGILRWVPDGQKAGHVWVQERHRWVMEEGTRLLDEHDPWCGVIGMGILDEYGHGAEGKWQRRKGFILKMYSEVDKDVETLVEKFNPATLAIFSDHGWNCAVDSETLYLPWGPGRKGEGGRPVDKANWAAHTKEGIGLFMGENVVVGEMEAFSNLDFLPTLLDVLNVSPMVKFDGKSVVEFEDEDLEAVEARLKSLGYIE